ncbi:MAG TPA: class I SAM-dependent methyltransferase [Polyangiales bacterium]|nr:class I SAM-dependent methyltransferase [Polyangiales bacterium]
MSESTALVATEAHEEQEEVACPLCGERSSRLVLYGRDRLFARPGKYRIVACSTCELRYLSPRPTLAALGAHYPSSYFIYQRPDDLPAWTRSMAQKFSALRWQESLARLERVTGRLQPDAKVVDVGCGLNDYLVNLKALRGIEGIGVDFKPELAEYAREQLHMTVHSGTLQDVAFPDGEFDIVAMNEYLEHEPDPRGVLREARRITRPGGYLTIEVPCVESLPARMFGSCWSQVDSPRHLIHFTEKTLTEMLRREGWELVHTQTFGIPYVIGFSVLQALGFRHLGRLTAWERALAMLVSLPFILIAPLVDEFRFAVARAV